MIKIKRIGAATLILCLLFTINVFAGTQSKQGAEVSISLLTNVPTNMLQLTNKDVVEVYTGEVKVEKSNEIKQWPVTYYKEVRYRDFVEKPMEDVTLNDFQQTIYYTEPAPDGSPQQAVGILSIESIEFIDSDSYGSRWWVTYAGEMTYYIY